MSVSVNSNEQPLQDLQDQLNGQTGHYGITNGKLPGGVTPGSLATWQDQDAFFLSTADSKRNFGDAFRIPRSLQYYTGLTSSATVATTDDLPNPGSFGFHINTSTGAYSFAYNDAGTVVFPDVGTFSGTITDAQHGDRSAYVGTMHGFAQLSGTITAAQHGNLTTGTLHPFTVISGTVSDAQHGNRGNNGGSAHDIATSVDHGFMSTSDFTKLGAATASNTAGVIVMRSSPSKFINCGGLQVNGVSVVGAQGAVIVDVSGTLPVDGSATNPAICAQVNEISGKFNVWLARARAHGLIDT